MKSVKTVIAALLLLSAMSVSAQSERVTPYVNPFIGTGKVDANSLKGGNFPGATMPFGMVQLSPEEFICPNGDEASGYDYSCNTIYGFAHTHLSGTGCVDLLDVLMQPLAKPIAALTGQETFPETFRHAREQARVGYYAVRYDDSDILSELTATVRTGMTRITFPADRPHSLVFDMAHAESWGRSQDHHHQFAAPSDRLHHARGLPQAQRMAEGAFRIFLREIL